LALRRLGYRLDERVDEVGEAALRGQVLDLFPAGAAQPVRIEHAEERVMAVHAYDPVTQLTTERLSAVTVLPVSNGSKRLTKGRSATRASSTGYPNSTAPSTRCSICCRMPRSLSTRARTSASRERCADCRRL
jgi:transcription-repair coupling factor (superfamily II helicase)